MTKGYAVKKRIAVYSHTLNFWGGSFQYAKAFTEALGECDRDQYEIHVWHYEDAEWSDVCTRMGFPEHILGEYTFPPSFIPTAQKILDRLKKLPEDDEENRQALLAPLQAYTAEAELDAFAPHLVILPQMGCPRFVRGARHIGVIHDLMHRYETHFPEVGSEAEIASRESLFKSLITHCDTILVDSRVGRKHVMECYRQTREDQVKILPFVAFDEILNVKPQKPNFALPAKFFFYPAQFWMHKNHVGLAEAVALMREQSPDVLVVAAGNTDQNGYPPFMDTIKRNGLEKLFLTPGYLPVEELAWLYRHARALVMPTYFGPTNIPPLEAMALGCPVAISGIYGMPEQCGDAALYFAPDNALEIATVMQRLWCDDVICNTLREKGLKRTKLHSVATFKKQALRVVRATLPMEEFSTLASGSSLPKISIVIPTYNRAGMLPLTVDSMLAQEYPQDKFEIIICNNNSTDDTQQVLESYESQFSGRIKSLFEQRQGVHYTRNRAAYHASGDILYYTDDDMLADPRMLLEIAHFFARYPKVGSATGKVLPKWEITPPDWILELCNNYLLSLLDLGDREQSGPKDMGVFSCHQAMLRDVFFKSGGFHPENTAGEWIGDGETGLNITIGKMGYHFGYIPRAITHHMIPPKRMTQEYLNNRLGNQGNCDSYTEYREHRFSEDELRQRQPLHAANAEQCRQLYVQQQQQNDISWHITMGYVHYHMHRLRYENRLMKDPAWRELVLRNDWLDKSLYAENE